MLLLILKCHTSIEIQSSELFQALIETSYKEKLTEKLIKENIFNLFLFNFHMFNTLFIKIDAFVFLFSIFCTIKLMKNMAINLKFLKLNSIF
jgi:hypothetical protein